MVILALGLTMGCLAGLVLAWVTGVVGGVAAWIFGAAMSMATRLQTVRHVETRADCAQAMARPATSESCTPGAWARGMTNRRAASPQCAHRT